MSESPVIIATPAGSLTVYPRPPSANGACVVRAFSGVGFFDDVEIRVVFLSVPARICDRFCSNFRFDCPRRLCTALACQIYLARNQYLACPNQPSVEAPMIDGVAIEILRAGYGHCRVSICGEPGAFGIGDGMRSHYVEFVCTNEAMSDFASQLLQHFGGA